MTEPDPLEEQLTQSLATRVAGVRATTGLAAAAQAHARGRRRRSVTVMAAVAAVAAILIGATTLRADPTTGPGPVDEPPPAAAFTPCSDGGATDAGRATISELAAIADSVDAPGSLCRYTNPATGDPVRDASSTLTDEVGLDGGDTSQIAAALLAAPPAQSPCGLVDSPPPVELVVAFAVGDTIRTVAVPIDACLGVRLTHGDQGPALPVRESGEVLDLLFGLLRGTGTSPDPVPPESCVADVDATRGSVEGTPVWVRFCPGATGFTAPAEVPSDALVTHLDLLAALTESAEGQPPGGVGCGSTLGRTYRLQIGYADGDVAEVAGRTDPDCAGRLAGGAGTMVRGPETLGVYGVAMTAFGQHYADDFEASAPDAPLVCPADPGDPDSVNLDGDSTSLDTGYHLGAREPMLMPLPAVRGIVCTWPAGVGDPTIEDLTPEQAERARIGLHAIDGAMVDCAPSADPTYSAVVEDKTGTRRAVTIIESECSTVIRSRGGYGLGFAWLDR